MQSIRCMLLLLGLSVACVPGANADSPDVIRSDEVVEFFPTDAHRNADDTGWVVPVHGWIYEPEADSVWRELAIRRFADLLDLESDDALKQAHFRRKAAAFIVDNERGKRVGVRIAGQVFVCNASGANGHFHGRFEVSDRQIKAAPEAAAAAAEPGQLQIEALLAPPDRRTFDGVVHLVPPRGVSVISDIDDTIKISEVHDTKRLLRRTFWEPDAAVPGMAKLYARWEKSGAAFHYVTSSPWQLGASLHAFIESHFPRGSLAMREVRLKDLTVLNLLDDTHRHKRDAIIQLLETYPSRRFILVGDSSERDPEIYGQIARDHPDRIIRIFIRKPVPDEEVDGRFDRAFADLAADTWVVFTKASDVTFDLPTDLKPAAN